MTRRKLPIGIQTFAKLREDDCYYVDKTGFALCLIEEGTHYFLSRPQRFGKSLFLDTLAELFAGSEPLFRGLQARGRWDWGRRFPVIRLSFGGGVVQSRAELDRSIRAQVGRKCHKLGAYCADPDDIASCFAEVIAQASDTVGERTVVLIDEYDKPILDNLTRPDAAREIRDGLRNLYSVIKDADAHIRVAFLTGVNKFSKVSLFSGLNNLRDITVSPDYSAICGYTEADLESPFALELDGLDGQQVRDWYNGYNWYFAALGLDITAEDSSNAGRLDMAVRFKDQICLFEFKVVELAPDGGALAQIRQRGYADKCRTESQPIHLIGIEFSRERRSFVAFDVESLPC